MTVTVVTRWTGQRADVERNCARAKPMLLKLGADDFRVGEIYSGPWTGQWLVSVVYRDWTSYGKTQQAIGNDREFQQVLAEGARTTALQERTVIVSLDV